MADAGERADDKLMRLRYDGRCRLCGTALASGADAVYERSRRTVRCVECAPGQRLGAALSADLTHPHPGPDDRAPSEPAPVSDTPTAPPVAASGSLRLRAPASAVIAETLRIQALHPPRSRTARLFGKDPLSPDAGSWFSGALGELEVGRVLDHLGQGWHSIHAIPLGTRGSDIDHLVIGPGGVFTVNAKRHTGNVWVGNRVLMVNGKRTQHVRNAEHEGRRVARILTVPVTPLVVIVGARRLRIKERPKEVVVLRSGDLARWLSRSTPVLSATDAAAIAARASDLGTWGASAVPEPDLAAFAKLREARASAQRRRVAWAMAGIAAVPIGAMSLPMIGPVLSAIFSALLG